MTGNVTQLVIDGLDLLWDAGDDDTRKRGAKFFRPIVSFAVGCIGGGYAAVNVGFMALALPMLVILLLAVAA